MNWLGSTALISLLAACVGSFPATNPGELSEDIDLGLSPEMSSGQPQPTPGRTPNVPVDSGIAQTDMRQCSRRWPEACGLPCADGIPQNELLHVESQEIFELPEGSHQYRCVVIEGTLKIRGSTQVNADVFSLTPLGRVDGVGTGLNGPGQGSDGGSREFRGSGGGGASGMCRGGAGSPLVANFRIRSLEGAPSGNTHRDFLAAGGPGGRGGSGRTPWYTIVPGAEGGLGGASLQVRGNQCHFAGQISLAGLPGNAGGNQAVGGGGGGAAGNLSVECSHVLITDQTFDLDLSGGPGGQGGSANGQYPGGGGGGGSGGAVKVAARRASLNGVPLPTTAALAQRLIDQIDLSGGLGGRHGQSGSDVENGKPGAGCQASFDAN